MSWARGSLFFHIAELNMFISGYSSFKFFYHESIYERFKKSPGGTSQIAIF